jgi:hypothetical protein
MKALLGALVALALCSSPAHAEGPIYSGAERKLSVDAPRVEEAEIRVDGALDEPLWKEAAVLTGFTQFEPSEGAPASERTEVLVFYTPSALYLGIRAHATNPSRIRATLAERDRILQDDHVQILLDTFHDRRRAYALYVNPLGIQQDGIYNEGAGRRREERTDFSPDFLFESRGRLTPEGYVVELRIPLKSLKFPSGKRQSWGINVLRSVAATGAQEAWAPLSRGNPSRLEQSGTLAGIHDLKPGRLMELNPTATGKREGAADGAGGLRHGDFTPDFGVNARYGLTSNLTLDATFNPDFSQIEADAGQITVNERFAIFFPEKRPFFLEGMDLFSTPEPLVYTRSIVDPIAGAKLTGKVGALNLGYLGALDDSPLRSGSRYAPRPDRALFNIARVQRDVGAGSSLGAVFTDRETGEEFNRVAGLDGRIRFAGVYTWQFQGAGSWSRAWAPSAAGRDTALVNGRPLTVAAEERVSHLLLTSLDRTGRQWGFRLQAKDVPDAFRSDAGFIRRTGVTDFFYVTRLSFFGKPGSLLESWGPFFVGNRIYSGRGFWNGDEATEGSATLRMNFSLRGNNRLEAGYSNRFHLLDPSRYARHSFTDASGTLRTGEEAVRPVREMRGLHGLSARASSSYFKTVSGEVEAQWQETPIFAEGTRGAEWSVQGEMGVRPTESLRMHGSLRRSRIFRAADGSLYSDALVPRLKVEYQLTRAVFLRAVGQYTVEEVDVLRAPDGTPYLRGGKPFRLRRGRMAPEEEAQENPLRLDLLFSYQSSPGTVVFLGYGREVNDAGAYRFGALEPRADGLFLKVSYLFRN